MKRKLSDYNNELLEAVGDAQISLSRDRSATIRAWRKKYGKDVLWQVTEKILKKLVRSELRKHRRSDEEVR